MQHYRLTVAAGDADRRLDRFVADCLPQLSRTEVQRLIRNRGIRIAGAGARPSLTVEPGMVIDVTVPDPAPAVPRPEALPVVVLYQDADIAVVDKPPGMVVHPAAGHREGTLVNALLHEIGGLSGIGGIERPGIVHRLDRGTSGVMVVAKHDAAHRALARQFRERAVAKEYVALVWGTPRAGERLDQPIGRDLRHRARMSSRTARPRPALTTITAVEPLGGTALVHVSIGTGRTHQIRVHLGERGHPVVGDPVYGGVRRRLPARLAVLASLTRPFLHAARIGFVHPATGRSVAFEAPLPSDLGAVLGELRRRHHG